ncbi:MAG: hypothetical protein ABI885_14115 [Gammaproteobacteria bacterium]
MSSGASYLDVRDSAASPRASRSESNAFDSFNDDLVWILDKLVSRSGGVFGALSGHLLSERESNLLALTTARPEKPDTFFCALAAHSIGATEFDRRRRGDDAPVMRQGIWSPSANDPISASFRTLQLCFWPTLNVSVVATVCRPALHGPFSALEALAGEKLYPVLSRYVRLWWLHRFERRRADSLSAALDLSDVGVLLLDRRGDLTFANTRARVFLQHRDGICERERAVLAERSDDGVHFQAAIQHAIHCNLRSQPDPSRAERAPILQLSRSNGRRPLIVTVMPVERAAVDHRDAAVIAYLLDPEQNVDLLLAPVCALYRLTATETRLVIHMVSGVRLADAAEKMQIQAETARAYLEQVFLKTATHRQADLVRIMLSSISHTNARVDLALI